VTGKRETSKAVDTSQYVSQQVRTDTNTHKTKGILSDHTTQ